MKSLGRTGALMFALLFLSAWCTSSPLLADDPSMARMHTQTANVALLFPSQQVRPGSQMTGILQFYIDPEWHLYWKNPGDAGLAPSFDWQLPQGVEITDVQWPAPTRFERSGTYFYGYDKTPQWVVTFSFDPSMAEGTYPITLSAFWLACNGSCVPSSQQYECSVTLSSSAPPLPPFPLLDEARKTLPVDLVEGTATIDKKQLLVRMPIPPQQMAQVEQIVLFPEQEGLFSVDLLPQWAYKEGTLELSIPSLAGAHEKLLETGRFAGLVQILSRDQKRPATYALNVAYEPTALPPPAHSSAQWKPIDLSQVSTSMKTDRSMSVILLMAFLGGIILNVMPCVLPVIGLKILNLVSLRSVQGVRTFVHGLLFTFGVLTTFWILAGTLYLLEYFGSTVGWGFQLQEPYFVVALIIVLFGFALNLFGVFEIGTSLSAWAGEAEAQAKGAGSPSYKASFLSGMLATVVATPCTGPLLGSVLGFATTFHPTDGLLLFTAIGFGMAFPFLLVSLFPPLIRLFPRPGLWMTTVKEFLGFCLIATVAWLLWVLNAEVPTLSIVTVASGLTAIAFGLWIFGHWGSPVRSRLCRIVGRLFCLLFLIIGLLTLASEVDDRITTWLQTLLPQRASIPWEPFSKERLDQELSKGRTVFVKFSAKWCLTCQTNNLSFASPTVAEAFARQQIVALDADWTNGDPAITAMLRALGRNGVPVYAIFRQGKEPTILPELVTPEMIATAVTTETPS